MRWDSRHRQMAQELNEWVHDEGEGAVEGRPPDDAPAQHVAQWLEQQAREWSRAYAQGYRHGYADGQAAAQHTHPGTPARAGTDAAAETEPSTE